MSYKIVFLCITALSNAPMQLALRDDSTVPASPLVAFFSHASAGTTGYVLLFANFLFRNLIILHNKNMFVGVRDYY